MSRPSEPNKKLVINQTIIWTLPVRQRLIELWAEGHSTAAIGRALGCSKNAVISRARREPECAPRQSPLQYSGATDGTILAELELGRGTAETSRLLGVSTRRVSELRGAAGIEVRPQHELARPGGPRKGGRQLHVLTADDLAAVKRDLTNGVGVKTVAKTYRIAWSRAAAMRDALIITGVQRPVRLASTAGKPRTEAKSMPLVAMMLAAAEKPKLHLVADAPKMVRPDEPVGSCVWTEGNSRHDWTYCSAKRTRGCFCEHHARLAFVRQRAAA